MSEINKDEIAGMFADLMDYLDRRFGEVDRKFDGVNKRLDSSDMQFKNVSRRFDENDKAHLETHARLDALEKGVKRLDRQKENMSSVDDLEDRVEELEADMVLVKKTVAV